MKIKKINSLLFSLCIAYLFNACTNDKGNDKEIDAAMIENSVVKISNNLYAGKFEVSNSLYREFLNELSSDNKLSDLKVAQIDSNGWLALKGGITFVKYYHTSPSYNEFPVVNISYEAANLFCKWLTEKYNSNPNRRYKHVIFRLPTEEEWCFAAKGGKDSSIYSSGKFLKDSTGEYLCNFKFISDSLKKEIKYMAIEALSPVNSYPPNGYGLYNMSGNAAEMIAEKGISKGGSFNTTKEKLEINSRGYYSKSNFDLGFRYFMEETN